MTKHAVTNAAEAAARILDLRSTQAQNKLTPRVRDLLTSEERDLWDKFFTGRPLEQIEAFTRYN